MKMNKSFSGFTLPELLVVIAIITILAALAVGALASALSKAQMTGTMNNARQIYLAQFQMANDGAATGVVSQGWPGDLPAVPATLVDYLNVLLGKGYLRGGDAIKLMNAPGASWTATVTTTNGIDQLSAPAGTAALKSLAGPRRQSGACDFFASAGTTFMTRQSWMGPFRTVQRVSSRCVKAATRVSLGWAKPRKPVGPMVHNSRMRSAISLGMPTERRTLAILPCPSPP
jgi:prepilin-type N-terminal cleavage/methylation domain-containing protein